MVQAQELRIGNLLKANGIHGGEIKRFKHLHEDLNIAFFIDETVAGEYLSDCEPIPLTPEILEKAGFEKLPHFTIQNSIKKYIGRGRNISIGCMGTPNEMIFLTEEEENEVENIIVVRNYDYDGKTHLHQLQNLYFALTGQELQITL